MGDLSHMDGDDIFEESDDDQLPYQTPRQAFDRDQKKYVGIGEDSEEEEEMEEEPDFDDAVEDEKEEDE